jgi:hypothetical protein
MLPVTNGGCESVSVERRGEISGMAVQCWRLNALPTAYHSPQRLVGASKGTLHADTLIWRIVKQVQGLVLTVWQSALRI